MNHSLPCGDLVKGPIDHMKLVTQGHCVRKRQRATDFGGARIPITYNFCVFLTSSRGVGESMTGQQDLIKQADGVVPASHSYGRLLGFCRRVDQGLTGPPRCQGPYCLRMQWRGPIGAQRQRAGWGWILGGMQDAAMATAWKKGRGSAAIKSGADSNGD